MQVVVTGSSGMVGSVLCQRLAAEGHTVIPVDREPNRWDAALDAHTRRVDLLGAPDGYPLPADGVDVVVHCAANARVHDLVVRPLLARENIDTCFHALEYARRCGAHFVFTSSREVYGNQGREQYGEDDIVIGAMESPYAASKLAGEALVLAYRRSYGMATTIVRLSNVYGRHDLSDRFVPLAIRRALAGQELTIFGRDKRLDFTYIDDTIAGLVRLIDRLPRVDGATLNISSGRAHSLEEAAQLVSRELDLPLALGFGESRVGEVTHYRADLTRAGTLLGYEPAWSLADGIRETVRWVREQSRATR